MARPSLALSVASLVFLGFITIALGDGQVGTRFPFVWLEETCQIRVEDFFSFSGILVLSVLALALALFSCLSPCFSSIYREIFIKRETRSSISFLIDSHLLSLFFLNSFISILFFHSFLPFLPFLLSSFPFSSPFRLPFLPFLSSTPFPSSSDFLKGS